MSTEALTAASIPWERRDELGYAAALLQTVRLFAFSPVEAFTRLNPDCGLSGPLRFGVIVGSIGILLNILGAAIFGSVALFDLPPEIREVFEFTVAGRSLEWVPLLIALVTGSLVGMLVTLVVFPPIFVLLLFLWSAVLHGFLRVVGGIKHSEAGFKATFAVAAYSSLAFLAHLVPMVGDLVATLWVIALHTVGLAIVHRTSRMRAFLATALLPLGLLSLLVVVVLLAQSSSAS